MFIKHLYCENIGNCNNKHLGQRQQRLSSGAVIHTQRKTVQTHSRCTYVEDSLCVLCITAGQRLIQEDVEDQVVVLFMRTFILKDVKCFTASPALESLLQSRIKGMKHGGKAGVGLLRAAHRAKDTLGIPASKRGMMSSQMEACCSHIPAEGGRS